MLKDIRYAIRTLLKRPGFLLVALATLSLGIGATTAMFTVVNSVLLRPLQFPEPERIVLFEGVQPRLGIKQSNMSVPDVVDWQQQSQSFEQIAGFVTWGAFLATGDETERVRAAAVSPEFFPLFRVQPLSGRTFQPADVQAEGNAVTVISYALWQRRFGGSPDVVNSKITLSGESNTIVGIMPAGFNYPDDTELWTLYPLDVKGEARDNRYLNVLSRLKPGVSIAQAQTEMDTINQRLAQNYAETNSGWGVRLTELRERMVGELRTSLLMLFGAVAFVLLIACANVANLLLARSSARTKENAVRLAIGATRWRIVRQLLTEGVLLAAFGGAAGLLLAWWTTRSFSAATPPTNALPITPQFSIDWRVLLFTLGISLLAGVIFGLAPALRASKPALIPALKDDATMFFERTRTFSLRNLLVVTQVALSVVLLIAAGLFLRSLWQARTIDPGFDADKIVGLPLNINLLRYTKPQGREFYRRTIERVEAIPGVESASLARIAAVSGNSSVRSLLIEGRAGSDNQFRSEGAGAAPGNNDSVSANVIGPRYFQTMGIAFLQGRDFNTQDAEDHPLVVIVNEAFVRRHFPDADVLGKRLSFNGPEGPWREIVGVVRTSKYRSLGETPTPVAYLPLQQNHETGMTLHVRTSVDPAAVAGAIRNEVQSLEKNLPLGNPERMSDRVANSLYAARMGAILLAVFGGLALLLASIGLYGVMSFAVARRTRELGIRVALGAKPGDVFRLVLRQGMTLVIAGLVLGVGVAAAVTRLLASFLYGVSTTDVFTFTAIPVLLTMVALLACYLPARRATKVEPLVALRYE
jgi:putative ABC transport system permease protein